MQKGISMYETCSSPCPRIYCRKVSTRPSDTKLAVDIEVIAGYMEPVYPYQSAMYYQNYNTSVAENVMSPVQAALHMIPTSNSHSDSLHFPRRSPMHQVKKHDFVVSSGFVGRHVGKACSRGSIIAIL